MTHPQLHLTRADEPPAPRIDTDSAAIVDQAVESLARLRTSYWLGDAGVHLHALASLIAQSEALLPDAVAAARDQELTWDQIGELLGLSAATAARRYRQATPARTTS